MVIIKSFTKIITCCCFHNWLEIFRYISAFLISLSLLVNIPFSNSLGSNTWGDKMADWQSCFTIVDRSLIRERVQISASGHDTDQLGADFFRSCFQSLPNETELATGQNSLSGQLTEVIKSWLIICQRLSRLEIVGHATLLTNIIIGQCLCQQKQSANDWVFIAILYLVFLKCVLFQKKLATNAFVEEFLWKTIPDNMKNFCIEHL